MPASVTAYPAPSLCRESAGISVMNDEIFRGRTRDEICTKYNICYLQGVVWESPGSQEQLDKVREEITRYLNTVALRLITPTISLCSFLSSLYFSLSSYVIFTFSFKSYTQSPPGSNHCHYSVHIRTVAAMARGLLSPLSSISLYSSQPPV